MRFLLAAGAVWASFVIAPWVQGTAHADEAWQHPMFQDEKVLQIGADGGGDAPVSVRQVRQARSVTLHVREAGNPNG